MTYIVGMWKTDTYFMPPHNNDGAGTFTITITKLVKDGVLTSITYDNHPRFDRHDVFKHVNSLGVDVWNEPITYMPDELFTL